MAIWRVVSQKAGLKITYESGDAAEIFECGVVRRDTPVSMIIEWICSQQAALAWDLLVLPGGQVNQLLPECRGRA